MPAKWFNTIRSRQFREELKENRIDLKSRKLMFYPNANELFNHVGLQGGLCVLFVDNNYQEEDTDFYIDDNFLIRKSLFSNKLLIETTLIEGLKFKIEQYLGEHKTLQDIGVNYQYFMQKDTTNAGGNNSRDSFDNFTSSIKTDVNSVRINIPGDKWIWGDKNVFKECLVPEHKLSLNFTNASNDSHLSLNDRVVILRENESMKSSMGFQFDSIQEVVNFYKYARTKFFTRLLESRLSSHITSVIAYSDIPVLDFSSNEEINWDNSVINIDKQLFDKFDLSEMEIAYILECERPFAAKLIETVDNVGGGAEIFKNAGYDLEELNRWY